MKWIYSLLICLCLVSMSSAEQAGIRLQKPMPVHGHSGPKDGGALGMSGVIVKGAAALTLPANTTTTMQWPYETWDSANLHDNATNNSRIYSPSWAKFVSCSCFIQSLSATSSSVDGLIIAESGLQTYGMQSGTRMTWGGFSMTVTTGMVEVLTPGTSFYVCNYSNTDPSVSKTVVNGMFVKPNFSCFFYR